jgi:hypothetical protein
MRETDFGHLLPCGNELCYFLKNGSKLGTSRKKDQNGTPKLWAGPKWHRSNRDWQLYGTGQIGTGVDTDWQLIGLATDRTGNHVLKLTELTLVSVARRNEPTMNPLNPCELAQGTRLCLSAYHRYAPL